MFGPRPYSNQNPCSFDPYLRDISLYNAVFGAVFEKQLQFPGNAKCSTDPFCQAKGNKKYVLLEESYMHNQGLVACLF